jgi:copper chaperone
MTKVGLKVEGMSCQHCVKAITDALKGIGVKGEVDLSSKTVFVEYDESKVSITQIKSAIEEQGYDVL